MLNEPVFTKTYEQFTCDKTVLENDDLIVYKEGKKYLVKITQAGYCNYYEVEE